MNKLLISLLVFCSTSYATSFSPYADLTINAHWDSHYQDMEPMDLAKIAQDAGIKSFHLAFLTDAGNCTAAWGGQSSYSLSSQWGAHLTDQLHEQGVTTVVSFGGASGSDLSSACSADQLVNIFEQTVSVYQAQGLDFDIENGTANVPKLMQALATFYSKHPNVQLSFTLPVLPEGLTATGQDILRQATQQQIPYHANIMAMDYGPAYTQPMGGYAIQAATNLHDYLVSLYPQSSSQAVWQMVEVTPMIGVNDVSIEKFTLADASTLQQFAHEKQIGALSMWSVARDNPCSDQWASPICSGANLQQKPYEFAQRFLQGN